MCIEDLKDARRHHGKPEIMNTDRGSQFTSIEWIKTLKVVDIQISMDVAGAWRDSVIVERLCGRFSTKKCICALMTASRSHAKARDGIGHSTKSRRPDSSLDGHAPDQAHLKPSSPTRGAA